MFKIDALTGQGLMRLWGVDSWSDPGAEYFLWDGCCVFALVYQEAFYDIHIAMDKTRWKDCRCAGAEILKEFGGNRLRAVILPDRPAVCNYAKRMGFSGPEIEKHTTTNGRESDFYIMWREPGEYHGRSD